MMKLLSSIKEFFVKFHSLEIDTSKINFSKIMPLKRSEQQDTGVWIDQHAHEEEWHEEKQYEEKQYEEKPPSVNQTHIEPIFKKTDPKEIKPTFSMPKALTGEVRIKEVGRYFSGGVFEKALLTIDKSTLLIIGGAWLVAIIATGLAFMSVRDATQLKLKTETARALDPVMPKIARLSLNKEQYQPLLERLKKQFPMVQLEITGKPNLKIQNNNPDAFMDWLNAISYVDGMVSTVRWTMTSFCVGVECAGDALMQAELTAESINITQPETVAP
jgi:hypothetical protein